ncbi:MAG: hypothetical protein PHW11_05455 [Anaerolineaceae bacterium]|jgi:hypothetical protein|nr:hypothetical protein [Anaerolineaceae bacterium]MDD4042477.1 hypothetical protein [Anaerolineaceae bacterium]MDD4578524.1 hypothetical protein [Anaerolineaceae bacterium]
MKVKRIIFCMIVSILLAGSIKVDAANLTAANPPANEPWVTEHVDWYQGAGVGTNVSIAHHPTTGIAYISYYDYLNNELWMAKEVTPGTGNCHNNDDWDCTLIDSNGDVGKYSSIDIVRVPSNPPTPAYTKIGISYYDATNGALKYASYRTFPTGTWTIYLVDQRVWAGHETRGTFSSMKFNADNFPVIAYHAMSDDITEYGSVKLASYVTSGGSGCNSADGENWYCETIDRIDSVDELDHGTHPSLDFTWDGQVQVAFYNSSLGSLDFAWYSGFGGTCSNTEWSCDTIDDGLNRGQYVSLHAKDSSSDKTRMAYYNSFSGMLRYAESVSGGGGNCTSSSYNCYVVDTVGIPAVDYDLSLDVDGMGYPIIAYMDASEDLGARKLNIARPAPAYGEEVGNCGDVPPGNLFMYWTCKTIDGGSGYADEAGFVGVSVSPGGLATVAYSEYNSYDDETYLKVAQQHFMNYLPVIIR